MGARLDLVYTGPAKICNILCQCFCCLALDTESASICTVVYTSQCTVCMPMLLSCHIVYRIRKHVQCSLHKPRLLSCHVVHEKALTMWYVLAKHCIAQMQVGRINGE